MNQKACTTNSTVRRWLQLAVSRHYDDEQFTLLQYKSHLQYHTNVKKSKGNNYKTIIIIIIIITLQ